MGSKWMNLGNSSPSEISDSSSILLNKIESKWVKFRGRFCLISLFTFPFNFLSNQSHFACISIELSLFDDLGCGFWGVNFHFFMIFRVFRDFFMNLQYFCKILACKFEDFFNFRFLGIFYFLFYRPKTCCF